MTPRVAQAFLPTSANQPGSLLAYTDYAYYGQFNNEAAANTEKSALQVTGYVSANGAQQWGTFTNPQTTSGGSWATALSINAIPGAVPGAPPLGWTLAGTWREQHTMEALGTSL